jgi:hypothetical protein
MGKEVRLVLMQHLGAASAKVMVLVLVDSLTSLFFLAMFQGIRV